MSVKLDLKETESVVYTKYGQQLVIPKEVKSSFSRNKVFDWVGLDVIETVLTNKTSPISVDIGANIGNHTIFMAKFSQHVYAFEPQVKAGIRLPDNIAINSLSNVTILPYGLSSENDVLRLYVTKTGTGGGTTFVSELARSDAIDVKTKVRIGDAVMSELEVPHIDFIKIDVEGLESKAITGLSNTITRNKPVILMEWNNDITREGFKKMRIFEGLLNEYQVMGVISNYDRKRWGSSFMGRVNRFLYRIKNDKFPVLFEFSENQDFANILLVPNDDVGLISKLESKYKV